MGVITVSTVEGSKVKKTVSEDTTVEKNPSKFFFFFKPTQGESSPSPPWTHSLVNSDPEQGPPLF